MEVSHIITIMGWLLAPVCSALVVYIREQRKAAVAKREAEEAVNAAKAEAKSARDEALEKGVRALLRQQLINYHKEYVASGKPCPVRIKEQATAVHDAYTALGGNGTGTQLWHEIMEAHVE